jgi:hypothetical protein
LVEAPSGARLHYIFNTRNEKGNFIFLSCCYQMIILIFKGGLFDGEFDEPESAFQYAIDVVNNEKRINDNYELEGQAIKIPYGNEFMTSQKLCRLLKVSGPLEQST